MYVQPLLIQVYGRHHNLVDRYNVSISQMRQDVFCVVRFLVIPDYTSLDMTVTQIFSLAMWQVPLMEQNMLPFWST